MTQSDAARFIYICTLCGSSQVRRDAWVAWDVVGQVWVLDAAFDHAYCHHCLHSVRLDRVPLVSCPGGSDSAG